MKLLRIENLSSYNGNTVPNQFLIETKQNIYFQSYNTIIVKFNKKSKEISISKKFNESLTTSRYTRYFLKEIETFSLDSEKEVLEMIEKGNIKLVKYIKSFK